MFNFNAGMLSKDGTEITKVGTSSYRLVSSDVRVTMKKLEVVCVCVEGGGGGGGRRDH